MTAPKRALTLGWLKPHIARAGATREAKTTAELLNQVEALKAPSPNIYGRNVDREDGFNYSWYAKIRPDVIAAGIDPLRHWQEAGRFEGYAPYEGGPTTVDWSKVSPEEYAKLPAPRLEMPDMYFPAGTKTAYAIARLSDFGGRRPWRTFEAHMSAVNAEPGYPNGQGRGFFKWEGGKTLDTVFGAHNDWTIEFEIEIMEDKPGAFGVMLGGGTSYPQIGNNGQMKSVIHIGIEPPAGYVHPPRAPKLARAVAPVPKTWDIVEDFLGDISDWYRPQFDLNGATGLLCGPETVTASGYRPLLDTIPIVDGVRRMRIIDLGDDYALDDKGRQYRYIMPSLCKMLGDGVNYYVEMDFRYPQKQGLDPGIWYWHEGKEMDDLEIWMGDRAHTASFHMLDGRVPTYNPYGPADVRRTLCVLRQYDPSGGPGRYAQWMKYEGETEKRLIIDGPNYMGNTPFPRQFTFEGLGGSVAGGVDPSINWSEVEGELHALRFKQL